MQDINSELEQILKSHNIQKNELMSKHTSFKIGGKADYFVRVETEEELINLLKLCENKSIPYQVVGNGTNLLVKDSGIRGIVIKIDIKDYKIEEKHGCFFITAGAGMNLANLAQIAYEHGLSGFEFAAGIPGTIGGAIRMNAGAFGGEMKDIVISTKCMDKSGKIIELSNEQQKFEYRKSIFETVDLIILQTIIKLQKDSKINIKTKMSELAEIRRKKQPLEYPNAGSIFKRCEDIPTAKMIDECGLKGYKIGDAEVSTKHSGFIVNKGKANASDVIKLTEHIRKEVKEKFDKDIELEILILG